MFTLVLLIDGKLAVRGDYYLLVGILLVGMSLGIALL